MLSRRVPRGLQLGVERQIELEDVDARLAENTENPAARAIAAIPKYEAGVRAAVESGKLQRGLSRVTLQSWQQSASTVGAARLQSGVQKGEAKMASFLTQFIPFQQSVASAVRAMPSLTETDRENRMLEQVRRTRQFRRTGS